MTPQTVLDFWFAEENRPFLFAKNDEFDAKIRARFFDVWQQAARGELAHWRDTLQGRLAEIILLDQFSRNLFRNSPQAFAQDLAALILAQEAVRQPGFAALLSHERHFMLMPLMHSESQVSTNKPFRCLNAIPTDTHWILKSNTKSSSTASDAIRTAMPYWGVKARRKRRNF